MLLSVEPVPPENDPFGEPTAVKVQTRDADEKKRVLRAVIPTRVLPPASARSSAAGPKSSP